MSRLSLLQGCSFPKLPESCTPLQLSTGFSHLTLCDRILCATFQSLLGPEPLEAHPSWRLTVTALLGIAGIAKRCKRDVTDLKRACVWVIDMVGVRRTLKQKRAWVNVLTVVICISCSPPFFFLCYWYIKDRCFCSLMEM